MLRDQRIAREIRGDGVRRVRRLRPGARKFVSFPGDSCQIAWWPGQERLIWIEAQGKRRHSCRLGPADGSRVETLIDLPGRYSHEFFRASAATAAGRLGGLRRRSRAGRADYEICL